MKKSKRKINKKKVFLYFLGFLFLLLAIGYFAIIRPEIKKSKEIVYDKLANVDEDTFAKLENTKVYDKNGKKIGEINSGNYQYTKISEVSKYIQEGYIAVEDKNFKSHHGIDYFAMFRAGVSYVIHHGNITQGGSTLTQQLVKNTFLSQEKTMKRKIVEFFLAPELEKKYTKADIIEYYVNSCYYGNRCYGVGNASSYYFKKKPRELTLSESALLIGLSNSPSAYDPVNHYDKSIQKRNRVLKHMLDEKVITKTQYNQAKNEKITIYQHRTGTSKENYQATFAVYEATLDLMKKDGFEFQYTFSDKEDYNDYKEKYNTEYAKYNQKIRNGGYMIYTTLDNEIQKQLQDSIDSELKDFKSKKNGKYQLQGAGVCIDNTTGNIVAAVGGRGTKDEYNRSYIAIRQPGSSLKPLIDYGPSFESGVYYPSKSVVDQKTAYGPSNSNRRYIGSTTVRYAITHSINTVAWTILQNIGVKNGLSYLSNMQFCNLSYLDNKNASASLGGLTNGVRVIDLAKGYATLENEGTYRDNSCIKKIKFKDETKATHKNTKKSIYSSATAYMLTDCMKDVITSGTGKNAAVKGQVIAGKTGTTNSYKDAWFSGYSKYYTTSVWIGNDNAKPMSDGITGGDYPAKIFSNFMTKIHEGKAKQDFTMPNTIEIRNGELYAKVVDETLKKSVLEVLQQRQYKAALKKVKKFKSFYINNVEDAIALESKYNSVLKSVDSVDDETKKAELRKRVEDHYTDLQSDYEKWKDDIATYNEEQEQERLATNEEAAKQAEINRKAYQKSSRIKLVKTYIRRLNATTVYDDTIEDLITTAETALEKCSIYDEYGTLKSSLDEAISYARGLEESSATNTTTEDKLQ